MMIGCFQAWELAGGVPKTTERNVPYKEGGNPPEKQNTKKGKRRRRRRKKHTHIPSFEVVK
jgi:hypothetical protein